MAARRGRTLSTSAQPRWSRVGRLSEPWGQLVGVALAGRPCFRDPRAVRTDRPEIGGSQPLAQPGGVAAGRSTLSVPGRTGQLPRCGGLVLGLAGSHRRTRRRTAGWGSHGMNRPVNCSGSLLTFAAMIGAVWRLDGQKSTQPARWLPCASRLLAVGPTWRRGWCAPSGGAECVSV